MSAGLRSGVVAMLAAAAVAAGCGGQDDGGTATGGEQAPAQNAQAEADGVQGTFSMIIMAHTGGSPGAYQVTDAQAPGSELEAGDEFTYRSIECSGDAPVNNIASDLPSFGAQIQDSRVPVSMRAHPLRFEVLEVEGEGVGVSGRMTATVCKLGPGPTPEDDPVADEEKPVIHFDFTGTLDQVSDDSTTFDGEFEIAGGTGRYERLSGSGEMTGYLFCFAPEGCEDTFDDSQFVLRGDYSHPDPRLEEPDLVLE